jgi:histidyl-tRNA synthetase
MELQLPRGMRDFPPEEKILRDEVISVLKGIFELYGFSPLETPVVERWEVLSAKYSGGEEILKETFKLTDQGGRQLGLRYDLTVPLARFVGMNPTIKRPFKRYQIGTVYRDGPIKKGRTREFYQCDADIVGSSSPLADAECVQLALDVFEKLGIDVEVKINNRKVLYELAQAAEIPEELTEAAILSLDKLEKIGPDGVLREMIERGIARVSAERFLSGAQDREALKKGEGYRELEPVLSALRGPSRGVDALARARLKLLHRDDLRSLCEELLSHGLAGCRRALRQHDRAVSWRQREDPCGRDFVRARADPRSSQREASQQNYAQDGHPSLCHSVQDAAR